MIPKYTVEYSVSYRIPAQTAHYSTDDPVACVEFLEVLLNLGCIIQAVKHEGVNLPQPDFDKMIKTAAGILAAKHICASLRIKPDEQHFRFGFAA